MVDETRCPQCGAALLAAGAACARCLLALGLETEGPPWDYGSGQSTVSLPRLPDRVGPYQVLDVLVRGEDGATYLGEARDGRRSALRVVKPAEDAQRVLERFEMERHRLADAAHPGVVSRIDAGATEDGGLWFATEWIPGVPITEFCDRERLPVRRRLEVLVEACEVIEHARSRGLLHLSLKPSRVLVVNEDGPCVRVIGFGVARALDRRPTAQLLYSGGGLLGGTLGFLSPEELDPSRPVLDARTDVYALGAVLYELMVGVPPFEPRRLLRAGWARTTRIVGEEAPTPPSQRAAGLGRDSDVTAQRRTEPRRLARELRGDLDWITLKALTKDPHRRHRSAGELANDLRGVLVGEPVAPGLRSAGRRLLRALGGSRL
jgi:serine/threonine protein kinase